MKIFGRKISNGNSKTFGRKVGNTFNTIGRKTINTIDKVAPMAAMIATASGHPEIGAGIMGGQVAAHSIDRAIRAGVSAGTSNKSNLDKRMVTFGNELETASADTQHVNALLRQ